MKKEKRPLPQKDDDVYDYEYRLSNAYSLLDRSDTISQEDKENIRAFIDHKHASGVSTGRLAKYVFHVKVIRENLGIRFKDATRKDIEALMSHLRSRNYTPHTISDYISILKIFYKFLRSGNTDYETPYPEEVIWLRNTIKPNERKEPEYATPEEVEAMIREADALRDKAMISVAYEAGLRAGELLLMNVGDIWFDEKGARARIGRGKTGGRTVRLISSSPLVSSYIETHPLRNVLEAPLWICEATNYANKRLSWVGWNRKLKEISKRAGVKKKSFHNHLLRHGSATQAARFLTESELKIRYGWSKSSKMASVYVHLSGADLDEKLERIYSGKPVEPEQPKFSPLVCARCSEKNSPATRYCRKCGSPLDAKEIERNRLEPEAIARKLEAMENKLASFLSSPLEGRKESSA